MTRPRSPRSSARRCAIAATRSPWRRAATRRWRSPSGSSRTPLDVGLPDIDGVTLAELVRGSVRHRMRVVAFSGHAETRLRGAVRRDVFDDYVKKPASLATLEAALSPGGTDARV